MLTLGTHALDLYVKSNGTAQSEDEQSQVAVPNGV